MIFKESETVELKSIVTDDIKKEIIAFANCEGGRLYVGVQNDGGVIGVDNPDNTALQISNMIRDAVKPDLTMFLHYETLNVEGRQIVAVDVQKGSDRPYYIAKKGLRPEGVYVRQGYFSAPATTAVIRQLIKETDGDRFEDMRSLEQDLTFEFAAKEFSARNIPFAQAQMKTLGLMSRDGVYTNLALLLSDQCSHTIKAAVFEGCDQNEFKDRREFSGSLFKQMHDVYDYIDFRNQTHSSFDKLLRIDNRDYPEVALREALFNLLVHREYSFSASSFIRIFQDRIEFTSIGGLVGGVTLNDISMGISVCRNVKLANVFYRLELIEAYGTGISKIIKAYSAYGKAPKIETSDNAFKITLPNLNYQSRETQKAPSYQSAPEEKVIALAESKGIVTRKDVETLLGTKQSSAGRILKNLVQSGQLIREGGGKSTRYRPEKT
ncbi:MAG: putative DNA binding domain-containing protein [Clostridia bacterium]|nr:putative DNA binding domain-containing protein [Clostridia bacterium]